MAARALPPAVRDALTNLNNTIDRIIVGDPRDPESMKAAIFTLLRNQDERIKTLEAAADKRKQWLMLLMGAAVTEGLAIAGILLFGK